MELYIIRHGQSANNALTNREDRGCDPPLTDLGRRQAELLAQHLATGPQRVPSAAEHGYGITRLYCSPMWRALQTAQFIGRALSLAPEVWIDLHEWGGVFLDHGKPEGIVGHPGKSRSEILEEFPDYVLPEGITEQGWWNQGLEDQAGGVARAIRVAQALHERSEGDERTAIVTHAGFIAMLLQTLIDLPPDYRLLYYHHHNTSISRIDLIRGEPLHIRYLNRLDHLPPELVT